jgi:hypothetical protein
MVPAPWLSQRHFPRTPYCQDMGTTHDDDEQKEHRRCGACFGEGGKWEELNGKSDKGFKRTKCRSFGGSSWQ